jgi:C4-dicarboxylate-specific signal transduction histidine kinase
MNLMINGIEAMKDVDGMRQLSINSHRPENEHLQISVIDTGVGLPPQKSGSDLQCFRYHQAEWDRHGAIY